jgi:hypothetical protein
MSGVQPAQADLMRHEIAFYADMFNKYVQTSPVRPAGVCSTRVRRDRCLTGHSAPSRCARCAKDDGGVLQEVRPALPRQGTQHG